METSKTIKFNITKTMDFQTYLSNMQNIKQMYEELISLAMGDQNGDRVRGLLIERDLQLDDLRKQFLGKPLLMQELPNKVRNEIMEVLRDAVADQGWFEIGYYLERIEKILIKNKEDLLTFVQDDSIL